MTVKEKQINKQDIKKELDQLAVEIDISCTVAICDIKSVLQSTYDSVLLNKEFTKNKIKKAKLADIRDLLKFYCDCVKAAKAKNKKKLELLSYFNLASHVVEDFMDRKVLKLLIKYNELYDSYTMPIKAIN